MKTGYPSSVRVYLMSISIVIFTDIIMDYILDYIQHDKYNERKRKNMKRPRLEIFLNDKVEHSTTIISIIM